MALNDWFTQQYALRLREVEQALQLGRPPLFVRVGDDLALLHDGRTHTASVRTPRYHALKLDAHVPVALYLALADGGDRELNAEERARLELLRQELSEDLDREASDSARAVSLAWLDEVLTREAVDREMLEQLERRTRQPIQRGIDEAARVEMGELNRVVRQWTAGWDRQAWHQARAVVCAGAQPRYRQSTKQYFQRLLEGSESQRGPGRGRVLYSESCQTSDDAIRHVATHLVDSKLGEAFMNSPLAMQQDLLAEAASRAIDALDLPGPAPED